MKVLEILESKYEKVGHLKLLREVNNSSLRVAVPSPRRRKREEGNDYM